MRKWWKRVEIEGKAIGNQRSVDFLCVWLIFFISCFLYFSWQPNKSCVILIFCFTWFWKKFFDVVFSVDAWCGVLWWSEAVRVRWMFFCSKCVKWAHFSILHNFASTDAIALRYSFNKLRSYCHPRNHSSQNRTGPGDRTVKIKNRDKNRFFKYKEPGICGNSLNS